MTRVLWARRGIRKSIYRGLDTETLVNRQTVQGVRAEREREGERERERESKREKPINRYKTRI